MYRLNSSQDSGPGIQFTCSNMGKVIKSFFSQQVCIGGEIIADMSLRYKIDLRDRIDGFNNCHGVICPQKEEKVFPVKRSNLPLPLYMYLKGTRYCLTMESPTVFPWEDRVEMHLKAIEITLTLME